MHEHLILDSDLIRESMPHISLPSVDSAIAEVSLCQEAGIDAMVDAMPAGGGRNPHKLAAVAETTGLHIVATTGLHTQKYYVEHPWAVDIEPESLVSLFVDDIEIGIDEHDYTGVAVERTDVRAGLIKVATDQDGMNDRAVRLFSTAVEAAQRTGVSILTHTEGGLGAMDQIEEFKRLSFPLGRVVISHTDKATDRGYHDEILSSGVNVEYDQALRGVREEPNATAVLTAEMVHRGYVNQLMLGTDGARRSLWTSLGGSPGLAYMGGEFLGDLRSLGLENDTIAVILEGNPQRFLGLAESR